ncbi:MAG: hypothetical protein HYV29_11045 [Ignavibacteriales bacterium]|nr:hypothetical protein [Ignavibacteriales bacterium]
MDRIRNMIFLFLFCSLPATLHSQVISESKLKYRTGYKLYDTAEHHNYQKQSSDTLHYGSLGSLKSDFQVNTDCGEYGSDQGYPDVAMDKNGNFLMIWLDERTGLRRVDAQLFNSEKQKNW